MTAPSVPPWTRDLDALLRTAVRLAPLLAYATPINFATEVARLEEAAERGEPLEPAFAYRPSPDGALDLSVKLLQSATALSVAEPLERVYAMRALQLHGDLLWAHALAEGGPLADGSGRFAGRDDGFDAAADALAAAWVEEAHERVGSLLAGGPHRARAGASPEEAFEALAGGDVISDDERDRRSLVSRMREEIGARRLPARVIVVKGIAPLAAAGDGVVQIAAGRRLSVEDVERTVVHEIEGHLVPACTAAAHPLGIFAIGTRHGSDDQEGRALLVERRLGHLGPFRRRTLALRHLAARAARDGTPFEAIVGRLRDAGAFPREAVRLAARAVRGRNLGREGVYLPAMLRVEAAVAADPDIDRVLAAGRVGVDDAEALAPYVGVRG